MTPQTYRLLADLVLLAHFAFVSFVVVGLLLIWLGHFARWPWVRNWRFRLLHLAAMGLVAAESLLSIICPLTSLEDRLRQLAGKRSAYAGSFVQHWVHRLMYYDAPEALFTIAYALFFGLVLLSLWCVKPRSNRFPPP